jgi:hypothetical protein
MALSCVAPLPQRGCDPVVVALALALVASSDLPLSVRSQTLADMAVQFSS